MEVKAKQKSKPRKPVPQKSTEDDEGEWKLEDLPLWQQKELLERIELAERGEDLLDFDQFMKNVDEKVDEIIAIANRPKKRKSVG